MVTDIPISRKKIYLLLCAMDLMFATFRYFIAPEKDLLFHFGVFLASLVGLVILWEFVIIMARFLEPFIPMDPRPYIRILVQTIITFAVLTVASVVFNQRQSKEMMALGYLVYFIVAALINVIFFSVIYFYNWKRDLVSLSDMQREQAIVKYEILRNQLNPHFLFNALTSLNSLIFANQELASDYLQQLSRVYRYTLQNKERDTVSVYTELEFLSSYIFLLKTRFGDSFEFTQTVDDLAMKKNIVAVITQMLVENTVKHNIIARLNPLRVKIWNDEKYLYVENSINRKDQVEASNKQGLINLIALYKFLSVDPLETYERNNHFVVRIPLV
jgi:hypothetical protein